MSAGRGICVHPQNPGFREQLPQFLLYLLRTGANMLHPPAAFRTGFRFRLRVAAVVAHQTAIGRVVRHGNAAPRTLRYIAAFTAKQVAAVAPAV